MSDASQGQPGLRDVAERAGVALSSASRVMANRPGVSPKMRERVLAAAAELGYRTNLLAQSFSRGTTQTVGFLARDIASPALPPILLGAETELRAAGYPMLLTDSEGVPDRDAEYIRLFDQRRVDGLILSLSDQQHAETRAELQALRVPFVLLDRELPASFGASSVIIDHATGFRQALAEAISRGHRRLGYLAGPEGLRPTMEAKAVLRDVQAAHRGVTTLIEAGTFTPEHGAAAASRLLADPIPPTLLLAGNAQILLGILEALHEHGLAIPADISLISIDDLPFLPYLATPISAIVRDHRGLGARAARLLLRRLQGNQTPEHETVTSAFVSRASVRDLRR